MKPTKPKAFFTRTLNNARAQSHTSLHQQKGAVRTWLWWNGEQAGSWLQSSPSIFQYTSVNIPVNDPYDASVMTGTQTANTFLTLGHLYNNFLADISVIKASWNPRNSLPTGSNQQVELLFLDWFDFNSLSSTVMDALAASTPTITLYDFKERVKQIYTMRMSQRVMAGGAIVLTKTWKRKFSVRKYLKDPHVDLQRQFPDFAGSTQQMYGVSNSALPSSPTTKMYWHGVVINMGSFLDTGNVWPVTAATNPQFSSDVGYYTKFYTPISWLGPSGI